MATRGSFESDQAIHATRRLNDYRFHRDTARRWTLLVEIVYPANRIVCDYTDRDGLIMLGAVRVRDGKTVGPDAARALTAATPCRTVYGRRSSVAKRGPLKRSMSLWTHSRMPATRRSRSP